MYWISTKLKNRFKKLHKSVPIQSHLHVELLELLCTCYFRKRHPLPNSDDPTQNLECIKIHELFMNDIILRLCKFRDTDTRNISFVQVLKKRKNKLETKSVQELTELVKKYRALTDNIEAHRNTRIAHLAKRDATNLKPPFEIDKAVRLALEIGDKLSGRREDYKLLGTDLRETVLDKETN